MRRGLLQDYAHTVCQILTGWRLLVSPGDLPLLLSHGSGRLELDLLARTAHLDGAPVQFSMVEELHEWLVARADADGLGAGALTTAQLEVRFECHERPGRWWRADVRTLTFTCSSVVATADRAAHGSHTSSEVATRRGNGPWVSG